MISKKNGRMNKNQIRSSVTVLGMGCFASFFSCGQSNAQVPVPRTDQQVIVTEPFSQSIFTKQDQAPQPPLDMEQVQIRLEESDARIKELEELIAKQKAAGEEKEEKKEPEKKEEKKDEKKDKKWFEKYTLRGYTQIRFNQELFVNPPSAPAQYVGDRSVSEDQSFLVRRARLILAGDMNDHASLYFQPDFAVTTPGSSDQTHFVQIRDLYADLYFDTDREYRVRVGQSKVPYGWENMQSSSNRLPLDRADGLNSAVRNERDLGAFFYWTPKPAQDFFKEVTDKGLKGSGNYGVFGLGAYNGQGGSFLETNDNLHVVSRLTIPMQFANGQYFEAGVQGYIGEYTVLSSGIRPLGVGTGSDKPTGAADTGNPQGWNDRRIAATWVWYPQPFGFQSEWTVGRGPGLNDAQTTIEDRALYGGYAMLIYNIENCYGHCYPFVRWSYYKGGYKSERNAPFVNINEWEFGNEWQINSAAELTMSYLITDRTNTNASTPTGIAPYQQFDGHVLRTQLQINY
jgi:Phosphate-selective porin O and P